MSMEYFCCYNDYLKKLEKLSDEEMGRLFRALLIYSSTGEQIDLIGMESLAFDFISFDIDRAKKSYEEKCLKNTENGRKGGRPKNGESPKPNGFFENQKNRMVFLKTQKTQEEEKKEKEEYEEEQEKVKKKNTKEKFVKPTLEEIKDYCSEQNYIHIDPEYFIDYYESNGWMAGKSKMKDWKATVRNWERRGKENGRTSNAKRDTSWQSTVDEGFLQRLERHKIDNIRPEDYATG